MKKFGIITICVFVLASAASAQENVGIGIASPLNRLHVLGSASSTDAVTYIRNNYVGSSDVRALETYSVPANAYGIGLYTTGGFKAIHAVGLQSSAGTESYGVYSTVTGAGSGAKYGVYSSVNNVSSSIQYGIYSRVSGGVKNWAGYFADGNVYTADSLWVGTNNGMARFDLLGGNWDLATREGDLRIGNASYRLKIGVATGGGGAGDARIYATGGTNRVIFGSNNADVMAIVPNNGGSVVIGSGLNPAAGYKLSVRGKAIFEEVLIQLQASWPDYVFDKDYKLTDLESLEQYIDLNKHLPNIPSALDIKNKGGIELGNMQGQLMEKVEELTLYIIDQHKQLKELKQQNLRIMQQLEQLQDKNGTDSK